MRWEADGSKRDERGQRLFAASEARAAGWGGVAAVAKITGVSRKRITAGLKDLAAPPLDLVAFVAREAVAVRSPRPTARSSSTSNTLSSQ